MPNENNTQKENATYETKLDHCSTEPLRQSLIDLLRQLGLLLNTYCTQQEMQKENESRILLTLDT